MFLVPTLVAFIGLAIIVLLSAVETRFYSRNLRLDALDLITLVLFIVSVVLSVVLLIAGA